VSDLGNERSVALEAGPIPGSFWIEPGRLLVGPYPGGQVERLAGIDVVVALTEESELPPYEVGPGVRLVRRAIPDFGCPEPDELRQTLDMLDRELAAGKVLYLHCRGGVGRTGMVTACYLIRRGATAEEALARLRAVGKGPEAEEQLRLVESWRG
jgi:protein-tyrosine phosphatase